MRDSGPGFPSRSRPRSPLTLCAPALGPAPGAFWTPERRCEFRVWAPRSQAVTLRLIQPGRADRLIDLQAVGLGWFALELEEVDPGDRYLFRLSPSGLERPDPASVHQPLGVHGPSEVIDRRFSWSEAERRWRGIPLAHYVILELHVGTFTPEGTFDAAISQLDRLVDLGITAVELMPVAQFPGERNWGYDGVYPFAPQSSYGGVEGLKRFVQACHERGLAVILDVVYNHLGPEGNYLRDFGSYFTNRYHTPWGDAINFDGPDSDTVREYFYHNALMWQTEYRFDALRLDAVHAIADLSASPFLAELKAVTAARATELGRPFYLIAESDQNDSRLIRPASVSGMGLDAVWSDDFHHALHVALTGETSGYYADFTAPGACLQRIWSGGFAYDGEYSPYRKRRHGNPAHDLEPFRFVVCSQNHDQVGNRAFGERLSVLTDLEGQKLALAATLLSPFTPLLFMGEEYGEDNPFLYFVSHGDPDLVEQVRQGRRNEFARFSWSDDIPDPQAFETFERSRPDPSKGLQEPGATLVRFTREVLRLRRDHPALRGGNPFPDRVDLDETGKVLRVHRRGGGSNGSVSAWLWFNLGDQPAALNLPPLDSNPTMTPNWHFHLLLDSSAGTWNGPGPGFPARLDGTAGTADQGLTGLRLPSRAVLVYGQDEALGSVSP